MAIVYKIYDNKDQLCKTRSIKFDKLEEALIIWINNSEAGNFILTEDLIKIKTVEFSNKLSVERFEPNSGCCIGSRGETISK